MRMDGFVLGKGPAGRCDDFRVGGAIVNHDPLSGLWRMWYYCRDRAFDPEAPSTLGSGRIALATSEDGVRWTRFDGPLAHGSVMEPSQDADAFDCLHVGLTDITQGAGEWLMWYFGGDRAAVDTRSHLGVVKGIGLRPGLARSPDGINWSRVAGHAGQGALIDIDHGCVYAAWPNVFYDGRRYIMQYTTPLYGLKDYRIRCAASYDGLLWEKLGLLEWDDGDRPWDCTGIITRQVLPNPIQGAKRWLMVYTGTDQNHARSVALAHSDDGLTWSHLYDAPIFKVGEEGAWDSFGVAATRLCLYRDKAHLYYYGFQSLGDDDNIRGIGLAVGSASDLRDLQRVQV